MFVKISHDIEKKWGVFKTNKYHCKIWQHYQFTEWHRFEPLYFLIWFCYNFLWFLVEESSVWSQERIDFKLTLRNFSITGQGVVMNFSPPLLHICIVVQYADPKMAGPSLISPAIFGSAYCNWNREVLICLIFYVVEFIAIFYIMYSLFEWRFYQGILST